MQPSDADRPAGSAPPPAGATETRLLAVTVAARQHGAELDRDDLRVPRGSIPSPAALVAWLQNAGLWARGTRLRWRQLLRHQGSGTMVLLLDDGSAALLVRADPASHAVWLRDAAGPGDGDGTPVDELRLSALWSGACILVRAERTGTLESEPFSFAWLARMVWTEKTILRDIGIGALVLSILQIVPAILVMVVLDKVVTYQSMSTLVLISLMLGATMIYEMYLGYVKRQLIQIVGTRLDSRLNLHVFKRILGLPIDYFEHTQTGRIMYQIGQIAKIRGFITGKLLTTLLDLITLAVLLPVLFVISAVLAWIVVACGGLIALIIAIFLRPTRRVYVKWLEAEIAKSTVLVETVQGIRTVKSLALEPQQREA